MNKIFSVFTVIILFGTLALAQMVPTVDIVITVSDNAGGYRALNVGLDTAATTGIDPQFGEENITFFPCLGCFESRLNLQPFGVGNILTYKDYRNAPAFPFSGQITHRLVWQYAYLATQLSISYYLPPQAQIRITSNNAVPIWDSGILAGSGTYTILDPDNEISTARVYMIYDGITPVELKSFTASVLGTTVKLNWITATELNNLGFELQRLNDSKIEKLKDWENIGFVNGNGTTTIENHYKFTDNEIIDGKYLYRLKQIDFDGSFNYSNVLEILIETLPKEFSLSDNYPNPFNPNTNIQFALPEDVNNVTLTIFNALGQKVAELVNSKLEAGKYSYVWNASDVATGLYIYELRTDKFVSVKKMMLLK